MCVLVPTRISCGLPGEGAPYDKRDSSGVDALSHKCKYHLRRIHGTEMNTAHFEIEAGHMLINMLLCKLLGNPDDYSGSAPRAFRFTIGVVIAVDDGKHAP